jgi:hypothetical protein
MAWPVIALGSRQLIVAVEALASGLALWLPGAWRRRLTRAAEVAPAEAARTAAPADSG